MIRTTINTLVILGLSLTVSQTAWAQDSAEFSFQNSEVELQTLPMGDGTCTLEVDAVTFESSPPGFVVDSIVVTGGDQTIELDPLYPIDECEEVDGTLICGPAWELPGESGFFASVSAPTGTSTYEVYQYTTSPKGKKLKQQEQVSLDCPCWLRWDLNDDGVVSTADLLLLLQIYGTSVEGTPNADLDVNGDAMIGSMELIDFLAQFGASCEDNEEPEDPCTPGAMWLSVQSLSSTGCHFVGEEQGDRAGWSVASAGDVDGDGLDDLLISGHLNDDGAVNAGKAYLVLGSSLDSSSTIDLSAADYTFVGENAHDRAGHSVASAGDVDGDGLDDLLIGAPYAGSGDAGKAYLVLGSSLGSSSTIDLADADYAFVGESGWNWWAGRSVASAGDVDGDGLDDLLIGAPQAFINAESGNAGKAYLLLGSSLGSSSTIDLSDADYTFVGENYGDMAGWSVASAGDVDGDGLDDLLVGAYFNDDGGNYAGKAYLLLGSSLGSSSTIDLADADYAFVGEDGGDWAGFSVASAGDVDGDGLDDLLIGAPHYYDAESGSSGKAYLVLGSSLGSSSTINLSTADYAFVGQNPAYGSGAGISVASAGDVDGDGLDDLLIGAPHNNDGVTNYFVGRAYLVLGSSLGSSSTIDLSDADYAFVGEDGGDRAGWSVASAGDVDGDGLDDLLIGAYGNDDGGEYAGKAYLLLSP